MAVEEWLSLNVPGWEILRENEKIALRDFPILWSYFEGWVTFPATAEPAKIVPKVDALAAASFDNIVAIDRAYEHYRNRFFPGGVKAPLFDTIGLRPQWKEFVQNILLDAGSEPRQRTKAVLIIINRLRNNFLHGGKALYNFRDQLDNFTHANDALMELLPKWGPPPP